MAILNSEINKRINHLVIDATRAFNGLQMESVSAVVAYKKLFVRYQRSVTMDNDLMPVDQAMQYADLLAALKIIGGDIDTVCLSLRAEVLRLRSALEEQWLIAHDEHCTNTRDCTSFGGIKQCKHQRP